MKYKIGLTVIISVFALLLVGIISTASSDCHWFIKRNGSSRPSFPPESAEIKRYNAYYIDENFPDASDKKKLYLTFDAGYENGNIEKILNTLRDEKVPAAFFILDNVVIKNTDLVNRMAEEGHLVCNHTKNHKNLSLASKEEIRENLCALEKLYKEKTGKEMAKYFRFPEGRYSLEALEAVSELGYTSVFWSFAYDDWDNHRQMEPAAAVKKVLENTHNGEILLLHPTSKTNAEILPTLIKEWRKMGYEFGTLDELNA